MTIYRRAETEGLTQICQNCKYKWQYKGKGITDEQTIYVSCPKCRYIVRINKNKKDVIK